MIGYIYQGAKKGLKGTDCQPVSKDEVNDLVTTYRAGGLDVIEATHAGLQTYQIEKDGMIAFFVIGDSVMDFARAAEAAGLRE